MEGRLQVPDLTLVNPNRPTSACNFGHCTFLPVLRRNSHRYIHQPNRPAWVRSSDRYTLPHMPIRWPPGAASRKPARGCTWGQFGGGALQPRTFDRQQSTRWCRQRRPRSQPERKFGSPGPAKIRTTASLLPYPRAVGEDPKKKPTLRKHPMWHHEPDLCSRIRPSNLPRRRGLPPRRISPPSASPGTTLARCAQMAF